MTLSTAIITGAALLFFGRIALGIPKLLRQIDQDARLDRIKPRWGLTYDRHASRFVPVRSGSTPPRLLSRRRLMTRPPGLSKNETTAGLMNKEEVERLPPCPFCGVDLTPASNGRGFVHPWRDDCPIDNASIFGAERIAQWNRRVPDPALTNALDQLEKAREALTPSAETKAAYGGEFFEDIDVPNPEYDPDDPESESEEPEFHHIRVPVQWTTIKAIMAAIRARAAHEGKE